MAPDNGFAARRERLLDLVRRVCQGELDPESFVHAAGELLHGLPLYPAGNIRELGVAAGDLLDRHPATAVDLVLRALSSESREVRALVTMILFRLARFQPGLWSDTVRHLLCDEDWEVRDLAARIFDTQDGQPGAAEYHLQFVCDRVEEWTRHADERVRRAATHALIGFAAAHPEFRPRFLKIIAPLLDDEREYVRHSLVAALRALGRSDPDGVFAFVEARINDAGDAARETLRLILDHPFADRQPERKAELLARL